MTTTRRGFIGRMIGAAAAVALAPVAKLLPVPEIAPMLAPAPLPTFSTWSNIETAAPLTAKSLREAIKMLENTPIEPWRPSKRLVLVATPAQAGHWSLR